MRIVIFCHSLRSDWNHGNAHFLRGVARELQARGHTVAAFEPHDGWSAVNLERDAGPDGLEEYRHAYPTLHAVVYDPRRLDLDNALAGADLVMVHEWNEPDLIERVGRYRSSGGRFALLFHDTHHRSATCRDTIAALDLSGYDGVLAFGEIVADRYRRAGWAQAVWAWHEAADVSVFYPRTAADDPLDVAWIGNWGDDERTAELDEFLLEPVRRLGMRGEAYGVRFPAAGRAAIARAGLTFMGRLANPRVPDVLARHRVTVHVPRRPYAQELPGIPTIRVFEALACGCPLICAPWEDVEQLFSPGDDYLIARNGSEMAQHLRTLRSDPARRTELAAHGRRTILDRHTCSHRVDELLHIVERIAPTMPGMEVA
jgi:spore maturation protein CgeB